MKRSKVYVKKGARKLASKPVKATAWKHYATPARRPSTRLVNKNGKLSLNYMEGLDSIEDMGERERVKEYMRLYHAKKKPLTLKEALWMVRNPHNKINTFLHNMGIEVESIVANLRSKGVSVDTHYLLNVDNWKFRKYSDGEALIILPDGRVAYFVFQYHAGYVLEVSA